jgi:hypothetical protein
VRISGNTQPAELLGVTGECPQQYVWFATYYNCNIKADGKEKANKKWKKDIKKTGQ